MSDAKSGKLTELERMLFGLLAIVALVFAWVAATSPASLESRETGPEGKLVKVVTTHQARTELAVLFTAIGILLVFVSANGARMTKLTIGTVSADLTPIEVKNAQRFVKSNGETIVVRYARSESLASQKPELPPAGKVIMGGEVLSIFSRDAVPQSVLQDALTNWPLDSAKPNELAELEFAATRAIPGEWYWLLKFEGRPAIGI